MRKLLTMAKGLLNVVRRYVASLFIVMAIMGCGGSDDEPDNTDTTITIPPGNDTTKPSTPVSNKCTQPNGTYKVTYTELNGDCGPLSDEIAVITPESFGHIEGTGCGGTITVSTDGCEITINAMCPGSTGYKFSMTGTLAISKDGSSELGEVQMALYNATTGYRYCSSIYRMKYSRQ